MAHSQFVLLAAVCFEPGLRAQDGAWLRLVDERLQDAHRLGEHHAFISVGGIRRMKTASRTGVEEELEYSSPTPSWNDPQAYAENGSKVAKGFTDCTQRRLPAPHRGSKSCGRKRAYPVLQQIHEHLRDLLELLPGRPILFLGQVSGWKAADRILLSTK